MDDQTGQAFDEAVDQEWASLRVELGDHFASLRCGTCFAIAAEGFDRPVAVVTRADSGETYEVVTEALKWADTDDDQVQRFQELRFEVEFLPSGDELRWRRPRIPTPDEAAWTAVQLCRVVYAVPSPAMLDLGPLATSAPVEPGIDSSDLDPAQPITVTGPDDLADAIELALEVAAPGAYTRDGRQFTVGDGPGALLIRPNEPRAAVWVVMFPVAVRPTSVAVREVQLLNRDAHFGRYYLRDGQLVAEAMLVAAPFVPSQLSEVIDGLIRETRALSSDFAWRTHGKVQCAFE